MRVALGIVRLFPESGLQRHCLDRARLLRGRGHHVMVFMAANLPDDFPLTLLPVRAFTNHGTDWAFARKFAAATAGRFDRIVGFNKLISLDVLYCADPPFDVPQRSWLHRLLPRHRRRLTLEGESFRPLSSAHIIALSGSFAEAYQQYWRLDARRKAADQDNVGIDCTQRRVDAFACRQNVVARRRGRARSIAAGAVRIFSRVADSPRRRSRSAGRDWRNLPRTALQALPGGAATAR
jgi:hypothetical protein